MSKSIKFMVVVALLFVLSLIPTSAQVDIETLFPAEEDVRASVALFDTQGELIGAIAMARFDDISMQGQLGVWVFIFDMPERGYHAMHIHSVGSCDMDDGFASAGGHFYPDETTHGSHAGDLPSLYVTRDGIALMMFITDAFTIFDLLDDDGSALVIHAGRDNYGNIPVRYGEPDDTTLATGDAGPRVACGVVERGISSTLDTIDD